MDLGKIIKSEIKKQNKSQREIAKIIGISDNSMSQICLGNSFPHKKTLKKICKCLNVNIGFFIINKS